MSEKRECPEFKNALTKVGDDGRDRLCRFGSDKRFGLRVMGFQIWGDGEFQLAYAAEDPAAEWVHISDH